MSDYDGHQRPGDTVPHQDDVEALVEDMGADVVDAQLAATSDHAAIPDVDVLVPVTTIETVASASAAYVEAEADAAVAAINFLIAQGAATETNVVALDGKVNEILDVLRDAGLIPVS